MAVEVRAVGRGFAGQFAALRAWMVLLVAVGGCVNSVDLGSGPLLSGPGPWHTVDGILYDLCDDVQAIEAGLDGGDLARDRSSLQVSCSDDADAIRYLERTTGGQDDSIADDRVMSARQAHSRMRPTSRTTPTAAPSPPRLVVDRTIDPDVVALLGDVLTPSGLNGLSFITGIENRSVLRLSGMTGCDEHYLMGTGGAVIVHVNSLGATYRVTVTNEASDPSFGTTVKTPEGIGIGSTLADVQRGYPDAFVSDPLPDGHQGVGLWIGDQTLYGFDLVDGIVNSMAVGGPGTMAEPLQCLPTLNASFWPSGGSGPSQTTIDGDGLSRARRLAEQV